MRLADSDLGSVPGAAAWYDHSGARIAATPEWQGCAPGTAVYRAGELTLLVSVGEYDPDVAALCARLITALQSGSAQTASRQRLRLDMLVASFRMILGEHRPLEGFSDEVFAGLDAALELANPPLHLDLRGGDRYACPTPLLVALALKQLATNAQRHGSATALTLSVDDGPTFRLRWRGIPPAQPIATSRHPARRVRWGTGFTRLAADAVGAAIYDPAVVDGDTLEVTFAIEPGDRQLRLPLATVDESDLVVRATRSWDEETHALPGQRLGDPDAILATRRAGARRGRTAAGGPFAARRVHAGTWIALMPADLRAQALDLVAGLAHEHDLLRVPEPHRSQALGLAAVIRTALGQTPEPWDPRAVVGPFRTAALALGVPPDSLLIPSNAPCAPDPLLTAFLIAELGGRAVWDSLSSRWRLDSFHEPRSSTISGALATGNGDIFLT